MYFKESEWVADILPCPNCGKKNYRVVGNIYHDSLGSFCSKNCIDQEKKVFKSIYEQIIKEHQ